MRILLLSTRVPLTLLVVSCWLASSGCDRGVDKRPGASSETTDNGASEGAADQSRERMIEANFASLSPEDHDAAHKQGFCPVADGQLGTMGAPVKITLNGQPVFLCCEHCRAEAESEPEKTLERVAALLEKAAEEDARVGGSRPSE